MRILVTGGAGFIGSHLCERLCSDGAEVVCLDNFSTGRRRNIAQLAERPNFALLEHDIVAPLPPLAVDEIWNLACPASPPHYQRNPIHTMKTSVLGMLNVLDLARRQGARVLQASTSEIYGDPEIHPQTESYRGAVNPIGPRACYDEGKRAAETLCFDARRQFGLDVKVARIFNTYGPRMDPEDGRVVSNFVTRALTGAPLEIYGDGRQTRSFCYVDDLVEGLYRLMRAPAHVSGPVNLGNPGEFTVVELARMVLRLTASQSQIVYRPLPQDDPRQRRPDISLARDLLGWQPSISLEQGLKPTIAYFTSELFPERLAASAEAAE